jgi:carbon monoxide dehydrogenase subunit G
MSQKHDETPAEDEDDRYLEFADTIALETTKKALWETISDPEVLTMCVPGAEEIERVSKRKYTVEITRGVSKLTLSLSGEAEFVEMNPPEYIVTTATAFDSKTGSEFEILAAMEMDETDDGAVTLTYKAEVSYSGGAAGISRRVLRPIVERDVDSYFENIKRRVEAEKGST